MADCVIVREIATACGRRFGYATLNAEKSLNALSLEMIDVLQAQLDVWADDPAIVGVVLDGAGDRAFCAGGDVVAVYHAIKAEEPGRIPQLAKDFFEHEYRLDYRIHGYPKPLLCWGHGIVMGGGIGLIAGASHRVATPKTRMAMPEITIGLYPDVGGSWFLRRMPGHTGLFLALTGAPLNAEDARFAGLADFVLANEDKAALLAALGEARWEAADSGAAANHAHLSHMLESFALRNGLPESLLRRYFDAIETVIGHDGLLDIAARLSALSDHPDAWLAAAGSTFLKGAPSTAALSYALWQRVLRCSLADVLRLEYQVSTACTAFPDFPEGVRALLVDKDRTPRWQHASVADVDAQFIEAHFKPHFSGPHPLADLR